MKESFIAKVYARSLYELGQEANISIADELTVLVDAVRSSDAFENALYLEVFTTEEKLDVFRAISEKMNLSSVISHTCLYLIAEKRMNLLPLIYKELIVIDDHERGFLRGVVEGHRDAISEDLKNNIKNFLKNKTGRDPILEYTQNPNITAGYRVTAGDLQFDASLDSVLEQFKQNVLN